MSVKISLFFRPYQIPRGTHLSVCVDVARAADEAGLYSISFGDHLLLGSNLSAYPYGAFLHRSESAWPEPLITLAAMSAVTKNLRLGTGILLANLRSPVLLAKSIATLDCLSQGRTELAIGLGWQREEYEACGIPWEERYRRLDEAVAACRALWGDQPVDFVSENVTIKDAWALPRPEQARVPLLYGVAMTSRNAHRIAKYGDGWCPVGIDVGQIKAGVDLLASVLPEYGRDISSQHINVGLPHVCDNDGKIDVCRTLEPVGEHLEAGATNIIVTGPPEPKSMSEVYELIEALGKARQGFG